MVEVKYFSVSKISFINSFIILSIPFPDLQEISKYFKAFALSNSFIVSLDTFLLTEASSEKFPTK